MRIRLQSLAEPLLQFGDAVTASEPKRGFLKGGPWSALSVGGERAIQLGLVGLASEVALVRPWLARLKDLIVADESNIRRNPQFPGSRKAFRCNFEVPDGFERAIDDSQFARAFEANDGAFEQLLDLYTGKIAGFFGDVRPDCVLVCLPESLADMRVINPKLTQKERQVLERLARDEVDEQLSFFDPSEEELRLARDLKPQAEELLFRTFYRALKARCMMEANPVPIQILRRHTYVSTEQKQSPATIAWNIGTSLFYKAGNIPWRPHSMASDTCFVGVTFHHLKRRKGDVIYASLAQAFASDVEPFALQGAAILPDQVRNREPYLSAEQASELMRNVIAEYERRTGARPVRVIVHKSSRYQPEEEEGFYAGLISEVPACDLIWLRPTGFRLLRRGQQEPWRGAFVTVGDDTHFLFTTGFIPEWDEYPGPHIPAPIQIGSARPTDILERAREILLLTKMNWNNAEGIGGAPITLSFARRVGAIMTELPDGATPNPLYRFYM